MKNYNALLVGNPNTGKTTFFNILSKSNEHVGNFHGVTVAEKEKEYIFDGNKFFLVDLPGTYSLSSFTQEECVTRDYIYRHSDFKVLNLCDQSNLRKNLYLSLNLLEYGCNMVVLINQIDKNPIYKVNTKKMSQMLGVDVFVIDEKDKSFVSKINNNIKIKRDVKIPLYLKKLNLTKVKQLISNFFPVSKLDYFAIKILEKDEYALSKIPNNVKKILEREIPNNFIEYIAKLRYEFIDKVLKSCTVRQDKIYGKSKLDKLFLNKYFSLPIFLLVLAGVFYITFFSLGKWISDLFVYVLNECFTNPITNLLSSLLGKDFWAVTLIKDAVFGGACTVLSFLPQIALLFMFLTLLEDSGYLSRIAFLFEDVLSKVGLSGKGVYTLLMGFGCSSSAIMTARTMKDKNAKIKTAMVTPYLSCSAKLPIYSVIGGAFLGINNIFLIMVLYLLGVVVAIFLSFIFDKTILKSKENFLLEFPAYKMPTLKKLLKVIFTNMRDFLIRIGLILISMNVIIWVLSNFSFSFKFLNGESGSMLEKIGKVLAVIFLPLGFSSWGNVSALLTGIIAKEAVVSSIILFNGQTLTLKESLMLPSSPSYFSGMASVVSFLVFSLLYAPCITSMAMLKKEIGMKWTLFSVLVQFIVAYLLSFVVFNLFRLFEFFGAIKCIVVILTILSILVSVIFLLSRIKRKKVCPKTCINCDDCLM